MMKKDKNKYAFFDMDGTLRGGYALNDSLHFLIQDGLIDDSYGYRIDHILEAYRSQKIDRRMGSTMALDLYAEAVRDRSRTEICNWMKMFIKNDSKMFAGSKELVGKLRQLGFRLVVISAGPRMVVEALVDGWGFDEIYASEFEVVGNKYTGKLLQLMDLEEKSYKVKQIIKNDKSNCLKFGFGDGIGDIEMLSLMEKAFVVNPRQDEMRILANKKGWIVVDQIRQIIPLIDDLGLDETK